MTCKKAAAFFLAFMMLILVSPTQALAEAYLGGDAREDDFTLAGGSVTVDGTKDQTVGISLIANIDVELWGVQGKWSLDTIDAGKTGYLAFDAENSSVVLEEFGCQNINIMPGSHGITDASVDEYGYSNVEISKGQVILTAAYTVSKDTPAGEYPVSFYDILLSDNVAEYCVLQAAYTATITVVRSDADEVYEIGSADELRSFADAVNGGKRYANAVLTRDINVSDEEWTPIKNYAGTFNGGGHMITYQCTTGGLFDTLTDSAVIQNLKVGGKASAVGVTASDTAVYVGGIAAMADGGSIVNCTNYAAVSGTNVKGIGGIVGCAAGAARIEDCVNYSAITAAASTEVGGIAGCTDSGSTGLITNCVNYGDMEGASNGGGIVGRAAGETLIEGCINYGALTSTSTGGTSYGFGGIAGKTEDSAAISGCFNYGDAVSQTTVGGIVGYASGGPVSQCANYGAVSLDNYYNVTYSGGIAGYLSSEGVDSCYNAGAVTVNAVKVYPSYGGGIAGYVTGNAEAVTNCYNEGSVSTSNKSLVPTAGEKLYVSGIIGGLQSAAAVSNCFNVGTITAEEEGNAPRSVVCYVSAAAGSASISNNYYLATCAEDLYAEAKSAEEFPTLAFAETLGEAYKKGSVHPLLIWQEDEPDVPDTSRLVVISILPADARFDLRDSDDEDAVVQPQSIQGGTYTYQLAAGKTYTYVAVRDGYYPVEEELPADTNFVSIALKKDVRVPAAPDAVIYGSGNTGMPNQIVSGGRYQIADSAAGRIEIATSEPVTLVGAQNLLTDLYIDCAVSGVKLTLENVRISNTAQANLIDFMGAGNYLYFCGINLLEQITNISGYAMIHVPLGTELTIGGTYDDDTLYLYKYEQGAGIGGNGTVSGSAQLPEYNGTITFTQGRIFMKGSKQGALIGAGAGASAAAGTPGSITINGGVLNLIANARGAAIGGSAGSTGASVGTNVYMNGGTLTVNVDYSGAAIGGGGYDKGNDQKDGGTLYYSGGSVRTYIDANAVEENLWPGMTQAGVNGNAAITAAITNGTDPLYLCVFDTSILDGLDEAGGRFTILDGGSMIYSGGLHTYRYINEDVHKDDQYDISDTTSNWGEGNDTCLYLYLTGETHELTVNGEEYIAEWDGASFYIHPASATMLAAPELSETAAEITQDAITLAAPAASVEDVEAVLEYRVSADGGITWSEWQASPAFTGLKANTEYSFQARYRAADTVRYSDSMPSTAVVIKTKEDPNAFKYEAAASGQTVTASVSGTSLVDFADSSGILTAGLVTGESGMTQMETTVSGATLAALAKSTEISAFALETDLGLIRFDGGAIAAIAADAGDSDALLTIIKNSDTEYSFALTVAGKQIFTGAEGGSIYLELPYSRQDDQLSVAVYDDAGNELETEYNPRSEVVAFSVTRLSDITIKEVKKGDPYASVWDGVSLDISWFSPGKSIYSISTPAQLMGLAALVNGIYNDEITTIVGDASYIVDNVSDGGGTGSSNQSTDTYHYGAYDFNGATVYLTADLDMGGSNGCNYMPIGGQYLMAKDDYSTKLSASFCGVFDGGGHTVSNIFCDRYCSGNYGDGSSVGLIGRLGVHDNDPESLRPTGAAVCNVAVDGSFYANRSVGGVVGKIGKTNGGATIENCANYATVISTDSKGCGGIVGAGWNGGAVRNCYNAGTIQSRYPNPTGGISGSNEITLENCYNVGSISASSDSFAMAIGTNNGGAPYSSSVINCWYLEGSAPGGGYYSGNTAYNDNALTADSMKTVEFATMMGSAFAMDTAKINNGYPVLAWQEQAAASVIIKSTTTVKDGVATTTVTEQAVSASITAAKKEAADTLYIITETEEENVAQTVVEIPRASVKAMAEASLKLSVETADGSRVTMTSDILSSAASQAQGETVELTVTPGTEEYAKELLGKADGYENIYLGNSVTVDIGISSGGVEISGFTSDFSIEIPVDSESFRLGAAYDVLQILSDGTVNKLSGQCITYGGQLYLSFSAAELGTFTVLSAQAGVVIASATTVKDGVATTTVTEEAVAASIMAARKAAADMLYIITDTEGESVDQTVVEIPRASVKEIAEALLSLSVETADGSRVTMSSDTLSAVAGQAAGEIVTLTVTPGTQEYAKELLGKAGGYENAYLGNSMTVSVGISSGGVEISGFTSDFSIEIPVDSESFQSGAAYDILQVLSDGTVNKLSGTCVLDGEQLSISFSASDLGTFIVLNSAPIIYDDVKPEDWFYEAVLYVTELGLMNGVGNNLFDPDGTTTRAMMVTVLYRLEGSPTISGMSTFADVTDDQWYTDAVIWAAKSGIVEGYGNGLFGTADFVTREQIATIMYRYAKFKGYDISVTTELSRYEDAGDISSWASTGMAWANASGLITGRTETTLVPVGSATRAEIATILQRFVNLMAQ